MAKIKVKVKVTKTFPDIKEHVRRIIDEEFVVSRERAKYLEKRGYVIIIGEVETTEEGTTTEEVEATEEVETTEEATTTEEVEATEEVETTEEEATTVEVKKAPAKNQKKNIK